VSTCKGTGLRGIFSNLPDSSEQNLVSDAEAWTLLCYVSKQSEIRKETLKA